MNAIVYIWTKPKLKLTESMKTATKQAVNCQQQQQQNNYKNNLQFDESYRIIMWYDVCTKCDNF